LLGKGETGCKKLGVCLGVEFRTGASPWTNAKVQAGSKGIVGGGKDPCEPTEVKIQGVRSIEALLLANESYHTRRGREPVRARVRSGN